MSTTGSAGRKRTGRLVPTGALILLAAGATLSCVNSDPTAPEGSTITVSADPQTVQPGIDSKITATVRSMNGTRLPDQEVIFTTTTGTLNPPAQTARTTDNNGQVSCVLSTDQTATVTASSGTITASTTVNVISCNLQTIIINSSLQTISSCLTTVGLTVEALDTNGEACAGVAVKIVTDTVPTGFNELTGSLSPAAQGVTDPMGMFTATFSPDQTQCQADCSLVSNPMATNGGACEVIFVAETISGSNPSSPAIVTESIP